MSTYKNELESFLDGNFDEVIVTTPIFFEAIKNRDPLIEKIAFQGREGIEGLNILIRESFKSKNEGLISDLTPLYEYTVSHIDDLNKSKSIHNGGHIIHNSNLTTIMIYETFRHGNPLQILPLIEYGEFTEYDLLDVCGDVLSNKNTRTKNILDSLKEKAKGFSQDPEVFLLYSYLACKYRQDKPKKDEFESILKSINPYIRFDDFKTLKEEIKVRKFGYGIQTQQLSEMLLEKAAFNAVEDFKVELENELTTTTATPRKMKI